MSQRSSASPKAMASSLSCIARRPASLFIFLLRWISVCRTAIDFEGLQDGDSLTNQLPGLTFINTTVLTSGFSLNEFDFPPYSRVNFVFDDGGPIDISFDTPISLFFAHFSRNVDVTKIYLWTLLLGEVK
jgi:hypothetical protein